MIHTNRIVTVGEQESIIDRPIVLYRGDREVEIEFTLVGNEFTFSEDGNVIKSVNASHGQLVLNTPSGEHMFSELAECHEGKVVFVVTKEMIDEFIEVGFYSFQIRLYDSAEMKSRVTIPPVMNGFDIRNPIAAEDETNVVDQGIVDYARIFKDQSNEELPTFDWTGAYNKTEWAHHDVITENKMNKIEDALYSINANVKESDAFMLNALGNIKKDADKYVKEHIAEVEADVEEFERNLNTGVERFKIDTNAAMTAHKNEVSEELEGLSSQLTHATNKTNLIINVKDFGVTGDGTINDTDTLVKAFEFAQENEAISKTIIFPKGVYLVNGESATSNNAEYGRLRVPSNTIIDLCGSEIKLVQNDRPNSSIFRIVNKENVVIKNGIFHGDFDNGNYVLAEWSFGVSGQDSKNIIVKDSSFYNFRGDGIYFSYGDNIENANDNILIKNCLVDTVHRNGISITRGKNVVIDGCTIRNTTGNSLGAGIDIEPDHDNEDEYVQHLVLSNNKFYNINGSALRVQYCKNAKVYSNTVLDSKTPVETREAYDIEIYDNYFDGIGGVNCSGYNLGNIVIRNNTIINFADTNLPGYVSSNILLGHTDKGGYGKIIFEDNIIRNAIIGNCMYISGGNVDIIRNTIDNIPGEFVRTTGTSNVNIFDNTVYNFSGAGFGVIRARDTSYINIKNNTFDTPTDIIIANNGDGAHNTDIQAYHPDVGAYIAGQFVRNGNKSYPLTMGWLCTSTGDFSTDTPPTFITIKYPQ